jgi:hypothetical protein
MGALSTCDVHTLLHPRVAIPRRLISMVLLRTLPRPRLSLVKAQCQRQCARLRLPLTQQSIFATSRPFKKREVGTVLVEVACK